MFCSFSQLPDFANVLVWELVIFFKASEKMVGFVKGDRLIVENTRIPLSQEGNALKNNTLISLLIFQYKDCSFLEGGKKHPFGHEEQFILYGN